MSVLLKFGARGIPAITVGFIASKCRRHDRAMSESHPYSVSFTYDANDPSEDRNIINTEVKGWSVAAVFDGHGGFNVAEYASKTLLAAVYERLPVEIDDEIDLDHSITAAFNDVELSYLNSIRKIYEMGFGSVAKVGSCVLLVLKRENHLIVSNCGDCRAVLGSVIASPTASEAAFATRISREHNARIPLEVLTLNTEHPNESNIVRCKSPHACYVKGRLQLTRSLGDAYLKYHEFNLPGTNGGRHIPEPYTPPYVKHTPDITHIRVDAAEDKFLILATDGLWDFVSDKEAVHLVASLKGGDGREKAAAQALVELALLKAAAECGMSVEKLKRLPPGRARRSRHDDTTVVVMYF